MCTLQVAVVVVVVTVLGCVTADIPMDEAIVPDIPDYAKYADRIFNRLNHDIKRLERTVVDVCGQRDSPILPQQISSTGQDELMVGLLHKIQAMSNELKQALTKITAIETGLQEKTQTLATSQDVQQVTSKVANLATKAEVEELLDTNTGKVQEAVRQAQAACGSDAKLTEVLQEVREVKGDVHEVAAEIEATKTEAQRCTEESTRHVRDVMTEMQELKENIQTLEADVGGRFGSLEDTVEEIVNHTRQPPPTPPPPPPTTTTLPPTTTTPGTVYPCEDSAFVGAQSFSVCRSAVRFRKCYLPAVSYHCCHTCTSEGQLPEMGPWRYENHQREVTTLDVIRFFTL